jgi:hypothetical protein
MPPFPPVFSPLVRSTSNSTWADSEIPNDFRRRTYFHIHSPTIVCAIASTTLVGWAGESRGCSRTGEIEWDGSGGTFFSPEAKR